MNYSALYTKLMIFAVLIAVGYFMAKKGILGNEFRKSASSLLVNVFLVASILSSILGERPALSTKGFIAAFAIISFTELLTYICAAVFCRFLKKDERNPQTEMMLDATNTLFVGLPVVSALCGNEAAFYIGTSCIAYNVLLYTYGVWRLQRGKGKSRISLRDLLSACLVASVAALVIFLINPPIPAPVKELITTVSSATVPLSMVIIGASMGAVNPAKAFTDGRNYLICLERLIVVPVITFLIVRMFTSDTTLLLCCTIIGGVPVGAVATPLSIQYGYDPEYAARATMVTTVFSMITIPVLVKLLFG